MKISIYIATQAERDFPKSNDYIPMMVGKPNENLSRGVNDGIGDSISSKNPFYCELTGHYWIWKNDHQSDVVGLAHYRRYLWVNDVSRRICKKIFKTLADCEPFLDTQNVTEIFTKGTHDIILPRPFVFSGGDIRNQFIEAHDKENFLLMIDAIKRHCPDYMKSFDTVFGRRFGYFANLLITKKPLFDEYSEWLFKILQDIEDHDDLTDKKNLRMMGFIAERLLNLYVVHNNLKIKEVPQIFVGEKSDYEKDMYTDLRYIKRRYFAGVLTLEENIRRIIRKKFSSK